MLHAYRAARARFCSQRCRAYALSVGKTIGRPSNRTTPPRRYDAPGYVKLTGNVRKRDNYTCQVCGAKQRRGMRAFDVHHTIPIRYGGADRIDNLITMCRPCHIRAELAQRDAEENGTAPYSLTGSAPPPRKPSGPPPVYPRGTVVCACGCGTEMPLRYSHRKPLRYVFGHGCRGRVMTQSTRDKIGNANRGRKASEETRAKLRARYQRKPE